MRRGVLGLLVVGASLVAGRSTAEEAKPIAPLRILAVGSGPRDEWNERPMTSTVDLPVKQIDLDGPPAHHLCVGPTNGAERISWEVLAVGKNVLPTLGAPTRAGFSATRCRLVTYADSPNGSGTTGGMFRARVELGGKVIETTVKTTVTWARREPIVTKVVIDEFRPGRAPGKLGDYGVIDPSAIGQPAREDGVFEIEGTCLQVLGTTFKSGAQDLTVLGGSADTRCRAGITNVVKLRGANLSAGAVIVEGPTGRAGRRFGRIGYRAIESRFMNDLLAGMKLTLGSPLRRGKLELLGQTSTFAVNGVNDNGVRLDVSDLGMKSAAIRFERVAEANEAMAVLEIAFEKDGRELTGSVLSKIDVFRCGGLRVERARCSSIDLGCFARTLGSAFQQAPLCGRREAWAADRVDGPNISLSGDLDDAVATIRVRLGVSEGSVVARETTGSVTGRISLSIADASLPLSRQEIQDRIFRELNTSLKAVFASSALGEELAKKLGGLLLAGMGTGATVRSLAVDARGSLFGDLLLRPTP